MDQRYRAMETPGGPAGQYRDIVRAPSRDARRTTSNDEDERGADEIGIDYSNTLARAKNAAFYIHQAAERYITCLLVHTGYRSKEHDMEKLIQQAAGFDHRFAAIFANDTRAERHLFDLLRRAYVDARYSKSYRIPETELNAIAQGVNRLKALTSEVFGMRIGALRERSRGQMKPM